jgi:hypothetical protein
MAKKIIAVVVLLLTVVGLAHSIELTARPETGRQGQEVHGGHDH